MSLDALKRDPSLWRIDDKVWVAERKKEWARVQTRLAGVTHSIHRKSWKHLKRYFMKGDIEYPSYFYVNGIEDIRHWQVYDIAMQIWLYPIEPKVSDIKIPENYRLQFENGRKQFYQNFYPMLKLKNDINANCYGVMGGREKQISQFLNPGLDFREPYEFSNMVTEGACVEPSAVYQSCMGSTLAETYNYAKENQLLHNRLTPIRYLPYRLGIYFWDHLDYALEKYPLGIHDTRLIDNPERISEKRVGEGRLTSERYFQKLLVEMLTFFDRSPDDEALQRSTSVELIEGLVSRYERRDFTDAMLSKWDEAKASIGSTR